MACEVSAVTLNSSNSVEKYAFIKLFPSILIGFNLDVIGFNLDVIGFNLDVTNYANRYSNPAF
ncbi:MAG: hypothetical protein UW09_C0003G0175 [candidate division TM6 bacterium GW2011_GWF2_43_87]|nr:MAG: hypothetical protein UW09_C0003G0175 [candidate division TM6 bacterium GW2011_GWF2_43_87]